MAPFVNPDDVDLKDGNDECRAENASDYHRIDDLVSLLLEQGAGAFIVSVVDHSYLVTLLSLWPTMSSYPSTIPVILA
ncbi:hypothetical protein GW17_00029506, partial [Ensete ventricosum]